LAIEVDIKRQIRIIKASYQNKLSIGTHRKQSYELNNTYKQKIYLSDYTVNFHLLKSEVLYYFGRFLIENTQLLKRIKQII